MARTFLEESYPLSPLQQGMLFYSSHTPQVGVDIEQIVIYFDEALNVPCFQQAWQAVVSRHAVLRTAFRWDAHTPLQDVYRHVVFPWTIEDWRALSPAEQEERFAHYLQNDRQAGFNLSELPLVRFALFRLDEAEYKFVWTFHHILMDGRSHLLLLKELFALYEQANAQSLLSSLPATSPPLMLSPNEPLPRPYRLHVEWLAEQDLSRGEQFWQQLLQGFTSPTPLLTPTGKSRTARQTAHTPKSPLKRGVTASTPLLRGAGGVLVFPFGLLTAPTRLNQPKEGHGEQEVSLSSELTSALTALANTHQLTLNTLVQGAWGLLLSRYSADKAGDVVFGAVRACRHSSLEGAEAMVGLFINTLPVRAQFTPEMPLLTFLKGLRAQSVAVRQYEQTPLVDVQAWSDVGGGKPLFESILVFDYYLLNVALQDDKPPQRREVRLIDQTAYPLTLYGYGGEELLLKLSYQRQRFDEATISRILAHLKELLKGMSANPACSVGSLSLLTDAERQQLLIDWNQTAVDYPQQATIHELFERQVKQTPAAVAVVFEDQSLTYHQLNQRANQLAHHLQGLGVVPDTPVGIYMNRSLDMIVGLFAILKAGGAYLPLDPTYPAERIRFMLSDAQVPLLLTEAQLEPQLPPHKAHPTELTKCVVRVDADWGTIGKQSVDAPATDVTSDNLAYVIYTSGSTGKPKGVMIEHRNAVNFFAGMDQCIPLAQNEPPGVWLAVTSLSFDISVLELFWTLARGFKVVLYDDRSRYTPARALNRSSASPDAGKEIEFSLFYFASEEAEEGVADKYRLLLEGAKFADQHGFSAIWTPERHFHAFGGLYPNPSVASAAIAAITKQIHIRAGSCVLPLHNPIRVAEEWALVDNLSNGRVGLSFASGWQPNDFVLMPQNYARRKEIMFRDIQVVRQLWRGETVSLLGPDGQEVTVSTLPRPIQEELPVWITVAGNPETYRMAGEGAYNVLTHLLGQSIEQLAEKLAIYRQAWQASGHAGKGHVTLMLHTFVGDDVDEVREIVRQPMMNYLKSAVSLVQKAGWYFPTAKEADTTSQKMVELSAKEQLTEEDVAAVLTYAFERYFETSGLFGTPTSCLGIVAQLKAIKVDEIACLIDFGVPSEMVLQHLEQLNQVQELAKVKPIKQEYSIAALIKRHDVTHFQCTPSMANMLLADDETGESLKAIETFMVGGEALPLALAHKLKKIVSGSVINMYGPTETTIWSTTYPVENTEQAISIGRPIANTQIYIVDRNRQPAPIGVAGELLIGGAGVVRGYLNRPHLTAERFIKNPFAAGRVYRTGDLVRYRADGQIEFLGRMDHQVKIRGYRIELGEIEMRLEEHPDVRQAVVIAASPPELGGRGIERLVAYLIASSKHHLLSAPQTRSETSELQAYLKEKLPDFMIPSHFITLEAFPLTPNKKIDRKALPAPSGTLPPQSMGGLRGGGETSLPKLGGIEGGRGRAGETSLPKLGGIEGGQAAAYAPPLNQLEEAIAQIWQELLQLPKVGRHDNFFDLGGHSLLAVQAHRRLREVMPNKTKISVMELFRYPTIRSLSQYLSRQVVDGKSPKSEQKSNQRVKARRQAMKGRQRRRR